MRPNFLAAAIPGSGIEIYPRPRPTHDRAAFSIVHTRSAPTARFGLLYRNILFLRIFRLCKMGLRTKPECSLLNKTFHGRVLNLDYPSKYGCGFDWHPFSPDIDPCNYFLWGFLKDQVYRQQFETIADLKAAIQNKISIIKLTVLESVVTSFENLLDIIIDKKEVILKNITANFESCYR